MATELEKLELENGRLRREIDVAKTSQGGSDKTVTRLMARIKELETGDIGADPGEEAEKPKPDTPEPPSSVAEREALLARKERVLALALDKGIAPEKAFSLLGLNGGGDSEALDALGEYTSDIKAETRTEVLKANGRTPERPRLQMRHSTLEEISRLPDEQIMSLPGDTINRAIAEHTGGKQTARKGILSSIFGGKK